MIIRTEKNRNNPYYMKNRAATEDPRLSWKAKGIHDYLMSKPDNWEANINQLVKAGPDGPSAVRAAVKELIKYGYIAKVQMRENGKIAGWRLDTFESPELNPFYKNGKAKLAIDDGGNGGDQDSENRDLEGDQDSDFQQVENLDRENREHNKYSPVVSIDLEGIAPPAEPEKETPAIPGKPYADAYLPKQEHSQKRAAMIALNAELDPKIRVPLVEPIAAYVGMTALIDADDAALMNVHRSAIKIHAMGATIDDLRRWWRTWKEDYRSNRPTLAQFEKFVSEQLEKSAPPPTTLQPQRRTIARGGSYAWS